MKKFKVVRALNDLAMFESAMNVYLNAGWKIVSVQMMVASVSGFFDVAYLEKEETQE